MRQLVHATSENALAHGASYAPRTTWNNFLGVAVVHSNKFRAGSLCGPPAIAPTRVMHPDYLIGAKRTR